MSAKWNVMYVEVCLPTGEWQLVGRLSADDPPGSITAIENGERRIYFFGWFDGAGPGLWRVLSTVIEAENPTFRAFVADDEKIQPVAEFQERGHVTLENLTVTGKSRLLRFTAGTEVSGQKAATN